MEKQSNNQTVGFPIASLDGTASSLRVDLYLQPGDTEDRLLREAPPKGQSQLSMAQNQNYNLIYTFLREFSSDVSSDLEPPAN